MVALNMAVGLLHHKYEHKGKKFDLAYITPRVIASAMPTNGRLQRLYRVRAKDLASFLNERHGRHWHIWNLQEDTELGYDPQTFGGERLDNIVSRYPIRDHTPPPFATLITLVRDIQSYLSEHDDNIALVHCKCGKGRTGMIIAAYLMATNGYTCEQAMREFTQKRIRMSVVDGVSITSQQRFLRYAEQFFLTGQGPTLLQPSFIRIVSVIIRNPSFEDFEFRLASLGQVNTPQEAPQGWTIVHKRKAVVLVPLEKQAILPVDVIGTYTGIIVQAGVRVPVTLASFAFNAAFEERTLQDDSSECQSVPVVALAPAPNSPAISTTSTEAAFGGASRFVCHWEMTDGLFGMKLRGSRCFDSIEVVWREATFEESSHFIASDNKEPLVQYV